MDRGRWTCQADARSHYHRALSRPAVGKDTEAWDVPARNRPENSTAKDEPAAGGEANSASGRETRAERERDRGKNNGMPRLVTADQKGTEQYSAQPNRGSPERPNRPGIQAWLRQFLRLFASVHISALGHNVRKRRGRRRLRRCRRRRWVGPRLFPSQHSIAALASCRIAAAVDAS